MFLVGISTDWRELIGVEYAKDSWATRVMEGIILDGRYTVVNELIMYKSRIYLVPSSQLKVNILRTFHGALMVAHLDFFKYTDKFRRDDMERT